MTDRQTVREAKTGAAEMDGQDDAHRKDERPGLPAGARILILAVAAAGVASAAVRIPDVASWRAVDAPAFLGLLSATVITEQFPIPLRYRTETLNFSLTDAVWMAAVILVRPSALILAVAAGIVVGQIMRRWTYYKIAFNAGQLLLAITVSQVIFQAANAAQPLEPIAWAVGAGAMGAYVAVSATLVAAVVALVEGKGLLSVLIPPLGANALHYAQNITIELLLAIAWSVSPLGIPLPVLPLVISYIAYQALVGRLREGDRVRELILSHSSDGIFLVSPDRTILSWNPGMERITGFSAEEAVGRIWEQDVAVSARSGKRKGLSLVTAGVTEGSRDSLITTKDGMRRWVHYSCDPIPGRGGRVSAFVVAARDVTAQREVERLKDDVVAIVSHELRTPLTPLKGCLVSLAQGIVDDTTDVRREYYQIMLNQADKLERMIRDLLDISTIQAGRLVVEPRSFELVGLVDRQVREFRSQFKGRTIEFESPGYPVWVKEDPIRTGQVVANLLCNALKYSPTDAPVEVEVAPAGDQALVSVRDHGEGIPASEHSKIFERFHRVKNGLTAGTSGSGLGLYISKQLVEAMSGQLFVVSHPGDGSTFSFTLPLARLSSLVSTVSAGGNGLGGVAAPPV